MKKIMTIFVLGLFLIVAASSVFAADKPDLEVNGMTAICGDVGEVCEFRVIIRNLRPVNTDEFKVKFEISPSTYDLLEGYSTVQQVSGLAAGGQTIVDIKFAPEKKATYTVKAIVDSANDIAETNEDNNEMTTEHSVPLIGVEAPPLPPGVTGGPPLPEAREVLKSRATPANCGVPVEFRDRTDAVILSSTIPGPGVIPGTVSKHAHGKPLGHLYLEGAYWVGLKSIQGKKASIILIPGNDANAEGISTTLNEGQSKEIGGVVIYAYDVGSDYIDYCIHETAKKALELTCAGCVTDSKCLAQGTRVVVDGSPSYCNIDNVLVEQDGEGAMCQNNYECTSNLCIDGECISPGLFKKIILWFKNLFG